MLDHCRTSLSKQHTVDLILFHGTYVDLTCGICMEGKIFEMIHKNINATKNVYFKYDYPTKMITHLTCVPSDVCELHLLGPGTMLDAGKHLRLEIKLEKRRREGGGGV